MRAVRDGDLAVLGVLFERYNTRLYSFILRLTQNESIAEDLLQEAFLNVIRYRHTFRDDSRFVPWLFNIARNLCYAHFRTHRFHGVPEKEAENHPDNRISIDEKVETESDIKWLSTAVNRLPYKYREVLLLTRYQGLKYEEVAEMLGCSVSAVKVRVHRAVKELRSKYAETEWNENHG